MGILGDYLPDWLPDDPNQNTAARQGLLAAGAALMGGRGNLGGILAGGLMAGQQGYNGALQQQQQSALMAAQQQRWDLENQATKTATDRAQQAQQIARDASQTVLAVDAPQTADAEASILSGFRLPGPSWMSADSGPVSQDSSASPVATPASAPLSGFRLPNPNWLAPANTAAQDVGGTPTITSLASLPKIGQSATTVNAAPMSMATQAYNDAIRVGTALANQGLVAEAKPYFDMADKLKPKYATDFKVAKGADGKLHNYLVAEDGTFKDAGLGVKPDMVSTDLGGKVVWNDKNELTAGQGFDKSLTPGEIQQSRDQAASREQSDRHWRAEQEDGNKPAVADETQAQQIAGYRAAPLGQFNLNKPWGQATMKRVLEINPNYDAAQYAPRAAALRSFAPGGKDGMAIESANTAMNHLATLKELALAQKNGGNRLFNQVANKLSAQFGGAAPTNLQAAVQMVAPEVVKAVSGVGGTGEDRAHTAAALAGNGTYSPDQIIGAVGTTQELFAGRLREKKRSYERGTGLKDFESAFLSPAAQGLLAGGGEAPPSARKIPGIKELPQKSQPAAHPDDINYLLNKYGNH